jgi:hypothetical protein
LAEITPERIVVDGPDGRATVDVEQLLSISAKQKPAQPPRKPEIRVELTDGSTVGVRQYSAREKSATIVLADGSPFDISTAAVRNVRLRSGGDALDAEWRRLAATQTDGDMLIVKNANSLDYLKGVLHEVTDDTVRFELDGEVLPVKRTKIVGIVYRHADAELPAAMCRVLDAFGSQWAAKTLSVAAQGCLQWTTPSGAAVALPADDVVRIDFSAGKIVYLSDLKADSVTWNPYVDAGQRFEAMERFYAPRVDQGFDLKPLAIGGERFEKGLAIHARTEMVYRLSDHFGRFRAVVGIDAARPNGAAKLIVRGDGKTLLELNVAGGESPKPINVDVSGVRRLTVVADFAQPAAAGDRLLLCDARLCK